MPSIHPSLLDRLQAWPTSEQASHRPPAWADDDLLHCFANAAEAAVAARTAPSVLTALAGRRGDEIATLASLAALAGALARITGRWQRAGVLGADLDDGEAQLVLEALEALWAAPGLPADAIVQKAWHRVSAKRRTELSRRSRSLPLQPLDLPAAEQGLPAGWAMWAASGLVLTATEAQTVLAAITGGKRSGCSVSSGAERTRRWRARRALRAALLEASDEPVRKEAV